jgi:CheY-like chemotaxis protein
MALILVVEDNPDNSMLAEKILRHVGHEPVVCETGSIARAWFQAHVPALVLMDLTLPDVDGFDLIGEMRADPRYSNIPFAILTAYAMTDYRERAEREHIDGYLVKPFMPRELMDLVHRLLPAGDSE